MIKSIGSWIRDEFAHAEDSIGRRQQRRCRRLDLARTLVECNNHRHKQKLWRICSIIWTSNSLSTHRDWTLSVHIIDKRCILLNEPTPCCVSSLSIERAGRNFVYIDVHDAVHLGRLVFLAVFFLCLLSSFCAERESEMKNYVDESKCFASTNNDHRVPFVQILYYFFLSHLSFVILFLQFTSSSSFHFFGFVVVRLNIFFVVEKMHYGQKASDYIVLPRNHVCGELVREVRLRLIGKVWAYNYPTGKFYDYNDVLALFD